MFKKDDDNKNCIKKNIKYIIRLMHNTHKKRGSGRFISGIKKFFTRKRKSNSQKNYAFKDIANKYAFKDKYAFKYIPDNDSIQCMKNVYWTETTYQDVVDTVCAHANHIAQTYNVIDINLCTYNRKFRSTDRTVSMITYEPKEKGKKPQQIFKKCVLIKTEDDWPSCIIHYKRQEQAGHKKILGLVCDAYNSIQNKRNSAVVEGVLNLALTGGGVLFTDSRFLSVKKMILNKNICHIIDI